MQMADSSEVAPEPLYTLFKHNLDDEFAKFCDQLYAFLPELEAKLHKYFQKVSGRRENNSFGSADVIALLPELTQDIVRNPNFFDSPKSARFGTLFQEICQFEKLAAESLESNLKSAENMEITRLLFLKIQPFERDVLAKFTATEVHFEVDADFEKLKTNFSDSFPLLKQYKKAVYKVQDFPLLFAFGHQTLLDKTKTFSRDTLEIEDVRLLHAALRPRLESLRSSLEIAAKLDLEAASAGAVC